MVHLHGKGGNVVAARAQRPPYNTPHVLCASRCESRLYRAGRTYLVRVPKAVVLNEGIRPGDTVEVSIRGVRGRLG